MVALVRLSPHFTAAELGVRADMPDAHLDALKRLCRDVLEPIREHVGGPMRVNDPKAGLTMRGWRPSASVGSATSQHLRGEAADFDLYGADLEPVWRWIAWESGLRFGQLIIERRRPGPWSWIHVSLGAPWRDPSRCQQVMCSPDGKTYRRMQKGEALP